VLGGPRGPVRRGHRLPAGGARAHRALGARPLRALGTDGFGLSDTRAALRRHFRIDAPNIVVAVLNELAGTGAVEPKLVREALDRYDLA
jgi:pyruvate dehydrogenase complex dehydrogenase (E1) component